MPSPFPGMDPFLESPAIFPDLHDSFVDTIKARFQRVLPPPYFAAGGSRVWVDVSERPVGPDVAVAKATGQSNVTGEVDSAVAVAPVRTEPVVVTVTSDEFREPFVELRAAGPGGERLVAVLEVSSPVNKRLGERGRNLYLRKQREVRGAGLHLIEIDLLRRGHHTTAVPAEWIEWRCGGYDYHAVVSPGDEPLRHEVYAWRLRQPLPEVRVPLLPGDGSVALDLQAIFAEAYDRGGHARRIDYADPAAVRPPLAPADAAWAAEVLSRTQ